MIKLYAMLSRRPDLSHEQFSEHWRTVHRALAVKIRRTRRYAQSHGLGEGLPGLRTQPWDGVAEVWLDDLAAASRSDPDLERYAKPDEPNFIAADGLQQVIAEHRPLRPWPEGGVKALLFVHRRQGLAEFAPRWRDLVASLDDLCADLTGVAAAVALPDAGPQPYDAVAELTWPDPETLRADWSRNGPAVRGALADLVQSDRAVAWLCEELRVTWPEGEASSPPTWPSPASAGPRTSS